MTTTRRGFVRTMLRGTAATFAVALTGTLAVRLGGYDVDERRAASLRALSPWQLALVDALADRMCLADVPYDSVGAPPTPREVGVGEFVDAFLASSPSHVLRDCKACFGLIEHGLPLAFGHVHRFTSLDGAAQDDVLTKMESSPRDLLRGAFHGMKSLVMMGYWRDPRTWGVMGYDGPQVARPAGGWTLLRHRPLVREGA